MISCFFEADDLVMSGISRTISSSPSTTTCAVLLGATDYAVLFFCISAKECSCKWVVLLGWKSETGADDENVAG